MAPKGGYSGVPQCFDANHRVNGRFSGTGQAVTDPEGRFIFEDVQVVEGDSYTVSVNHLGVFYGSSFEGGKFFPRSWY
ncbi:MAG: hypothetical protein CM1200mP27_06440 [Chloroflexota bacterium]|nr:MAG: hypothetical protein CM1200mP27_06440 [Chloroflexota bacterium]